MINLGKILILFLIIHNSIYATFTATLSATKVTEGDEVTLTFKSNVSSRFPVIDNIAGLPIESLSVSSSTSIENGVVTGTFIKHFLFYATKDITIPSYTMLENGKEVSTKPIKLKVTKDKQNNENGELFFKAYVSKKEVMVGEPFFVTLVYKQAKSLNVIDRRLEPPSGKHFWVEKQPIESAQNSPTHQIIKLKYIFTALKSGNLTIDPAHIKVGVAAYKNDVWGNLRLRPRYKPFSTDILKVKVNPLPQDVNNVGDFTFNVSVDKKKSNEKDAVNLTVSISGEGNIADIAAFKLPLDSVLIYDEKPNKKHAYRNGEYQGTFNQKFAIVSDHNYTIPALSFSYYSLKKRKTIVLKSKPINIEIKPTSTASTVKSVTVEKMTSTKQPETPQVVEHSRSWIELLVVLIVGIFLGFISRSFSWSVSTKTSESKLKTSDKKALLQAIMPFAESDEEVKELVEKLSEEIYDQVDHKHDKKQMRQLLKRLGIKF